MDFKRRLEKLEAVPPPTESLLRAMRAYSNTNELPKDPMLRDFIEKWVMLLEGVRASVEGPPTDAELEEVKS